MALVRVIPCLDIKDGRVVKGVNFAHLKDACDPVEAAEAYCEQGADELVFLDIAATLESRKIRLDWVKRVAKVVTVPFCVGGGIASLDDMSALFDVGVDKISINTAAVHDPDIIHEATDTYSPDNVVVAIDAEKGEERYEVLVAGGTQEAHLGLIEWAREVEDLGAGEILLTSKDTDGTCDGYDVEMLRAVTDAVSLPVIASGGCGKIEHFVEAVVRGHASAVLAASVFHFGELTIGDVKRHMKKSGLQVTI